MIRKTIMITSLAILVAAISVATTMTMVQADIDGNDVTVTIVSPAASPTSDTNAVSGALEYDGDLDGENALVTYADTAVDGVITTTAELTIDDPGVNLTSGDSFTFIGSGTSAVVLYTDGVGGGTLDGTIDAIGELSITNPGTLTVTPAQESITGDDSELTVDIDASLDVEIRLPAGPGTLEDIVIEIDTISWNPETGAIGSVTCTTSTGTMTDLLFDENTLEFTLSTHAGLSTGITVDCEFEAFHGDVNKTLDTDPCEVDIKGIAAENCFFTITYFGVPANIIDIVPAEWRVVGFTNNGVPVDADLTFLDDGGDAIVQIGELTVAEEGTNVPNGVFNFPDASTGAIVTFTDANGDKKVQIGELVVTDAGTATVVDDTVSLAAEAFETCSSEQSNKKTNNKSSTVITCNDATNVDTTVEVETRVSPGKGHLKKQGFVVFKPTFCGVFDINDGAQAILLDGPGGIPVLSTLDGEPIVLDSTDPLTAESFATGLFDCDGERIP